VLIAADIPGRKQSVESSLTFQKTFFAAGADLDRRNMAAEALVEQEF